MAEKKDYEHGPHHIAGLALLALCLFMALSLFSYEWTDISLLKVPPNSPPHNLIGPAGAWLSFVLLQLFGIGAFLMPLFCLAVGVIMMLQHNGRIWTKVLWTFLAMLCLVALMELHAEWWAPTCHKINLTFTGGLFGMLVVESIMIRWLSPVGTAILVSFALIALLILLVGVRRLLQSFRMLGTNLINLAAHLHEWFNERQDRYAQLSREERSLIKRRQQIEKKLKREQLATRRNARKNAADTSAPQPSEEEQDEDTPENEREGETGGIIERVINRPKRKSSEKTSQPANQDEDNETVYGAVRHENSPYVFPSLDMLDAGTAGIGGSAGDTEATARILTETLMDFGVEAEVINFTVGPVVTSYEVLPAAGVRVERISALSNNLALALKAHSLRVQAPIPGKGVVGIEVPNDHAQTVTLRDIMESKTWKNTKWHVPLILGKDVSGKTLIADLTRMPHLLIAGATGSGKTVCMNSILAGLLMSRHPDDLKLMLVDPKIVEFSGYNHLPHLVVPVITNPKKVSLGLRWAITEMEKRYKLFAKVGVRNIESFNSRKKVEQPELFEETNAESQPEKPTLPDRLPYIVIIIDELADLMLADGAEIENSIARLAQLSRAVGIHMILATQRPSVNVITGTIKANFPARIAFQTAQRTDSRTILDTVGADKLLGRGDMLYLPPGSSKLIRAQGALTTDEEIHKIVEFIKGQAQPDYETEIKDKIEKTSTVRGVDDGGEDEEILSQAIEIIRETKRASTSSLQRRLRIGYTRAARLMDILEERGIIGPPRGSDPREILIDLDGEIPDNPAENDLEGF